MSLLATLANTINVGTDNNEIYLDAAAAVALYEMASGGHYIVRKSAAIEALLSEHLLKMDGKETETHYNVTITNLGIAAKKRMRKNIF